MMDRLEDLRTLQDDFSSLLEPLTHISDELPRASMRIAELEILLTQELQHGGAARNELANLTGRISTIETELADAIVRGDQGEAALRDRDRSVEEQRIALRDSGLSTENLERQLFGEIEQNKALLVENKALRAEAQAVDSALSRSEHELAGARERLGILEQDNRRLQILSEEQSAQLVEIGGRYKELEGSADTERLRLRALEAQFADVAAERSRDDAVHETEIGALRTERAGLLMKLEAATNRGNSIDQLLVQLRNQLREKDEAHRVVERNFKEASIGRNTAERRFDAMQADLARQTERFLEMQRLRAELDGRCDMLTKALAAKDAAVEQAASRNASLSERIEQMTMRHEAARNELETTTRRLTEDLQNERSERTLVQGALDIARESRVSLQKQHEALKRSGRGWRGAAGECAEDEPKAHLDEPSNVRPFTGNAKST